MGPGESVASEVRPFSADMYLPMGGMRMNIEKNTEKSTPQIASQRQNHHSHIVQTAFAGVWSMYSPATPDFPRCRVGHFHCASQELNISVTGFGIGSDEQYLTDVWILNLTNLVWTPMNLNLQIPPRTGSSALIVDTTMFLFGGSHDSTYMNDLYAINVQTGQVQPLQTTGAIPSPRSGCVMGSLERELFIWGGFDGSGFPPDLYVLNLDTLVWTAFPQDVVGRSATAFAQRDNYIFSYGSSKTSGLLIINMKDKTVGLHQTTGAEPPPGVINPGMVTFDQYLLLIGGKSQSDWTLIYACDLDKLRWFVFHVLPDEKTVSTVDGNITELGLFMIPRVHSIGAVYSHKRRQVIGYLGFPLKTPPPLLILDIGEAMSMLNVRADMLERLHFDQPQLTPTPAQ